MPQLFLILEEGNTALLTRALGNIPTPRFASQGLLSTIASWCLESCGHELRVIASTNVRVVYRRFSNHLLFVLVTSNLLLHTDLLQSHLETLYALLLLLLGPTTLVLDTFAKINILKSKLRAPDVQRAVDSLVADDTLVPCILLTVPQLVGLSLRERANLQSGLVKIVSTLGCQHAALIGEGYYLSATPGWWTLLSPREQLLVQHVSTQHSKHHSDGCPPELQLHLSKRHYQAPLRLRILRLQGAVLLAALYESGGAPPPPLQDHEDMVRSHLNAVRYTLERPLWLSPPVPQFATISFDLALVVQHSPSSAVLLWGHGGGAAVQQGFNPLVSPSLRKQVGSSTSPIAARLANRPPSATREESQTAGGDGLQLFFRSTLDTLVSFVLQTWPQMPAELQVALQDRKADGGCGGGDPSGCNLVVQNQVKPRAMTTAPATTTIITTTTASSPPRGDHLHLQNNNINLLPQPQIHHYPNRSAPPAGAESLVMPQPPQPFVPLSAARGTSSVSRLGLGAIRRISSTALGSSMQGASRLQALFGRSSSAAGPVGVARGVVQGSMLAVPSGAAAAGTAGPLEEPAELADVPYEEVHAVIEGARLLALLDRSGRASAGGPSGGTGTGTGTGAAADVIDVFVAFPKCIGRMAALEAANTLRSTYLMVYHDDE
ncbi:hypothetical protein VaNZ11_009121 [Volvox africanus]|uniref:Vacuolar fusion protein MON1 homolog n=1 Tax=Volvox africanus TaxID=51714 RepID=A0ABQ5S7S6_9CHLO|nr:hypothetical protein VaNZ11_009121 [Volvox africanus]